MAFITLSGTLLDPNGDLAVGDQIRFTHNSTTGETVEGAVSIITVNPAGTYSLNLQYGLVLVEYKDTRTQQFKHLGVATVNGSNPATTIPELLNALVPVSSAELIEFQGILADCVTAQTAAENAATTAQAFAYQLTTTDLIANTATFTLATNIPTSGFTTSGDGGNGAWMQNGVTGQTPSQSPAQLVDALLNDGNGNQWELTGDFISNLQLGVVADEAADDTLATNASIAAANRLKLKLFIHGRFRTTARIDFTTDDLQVEFVSDAAIVPDISVIEALQIGDVVNQPSRMEIIRPTVDRGSYNGAVESIGIVFKEMNQSSVYDLESRWSKFPVKFFASAVSGGIAHNSFYNPQAIGGFINYSFSATGNGFCNENKFFGGRGFDGGNIDTQLRIEGGTAVNHNQFYGINLEGGTGDQAIYCDGEQNLFIAPRTENATGWNVDDVVYGPNARFNRVESPRLDLTVSDYSDDDTNTWQCRGSGSKIETGNNNINHHRAVHSGSHTTAAGESVVITGASNASPVVITSTAHGLLTGSYISIRKVVGMTPLNGQNYRLGTVTANTYELLNPTTGDNIDGTGFLAYVSGGYAMPGVPMNSIEDINSSSTVSHLYDYYHGEDGVTSYLFRSLRDSDGLVRSSLTTDGRMKLARRLEIEQSSFSFNPLQMGAYYIWVDSTGRLRMKNGAPASAEDGTVVGTQS